MDEIHKELRVRSRIAGIYNKRRDDFDSKDAWDDYLENVEDIKTEAKVAEYKRANQLNIFANQARQAEEQKVQQKTAVAAPAPVVEQPAAGPTFTMFKPQTLIAAQPQPVSVPAVNADGSLIIPRVSKPDFKSMAAASGWTTELPKSRALQEALSSLLIF